MQKAILIRKQFKFRIFKNFLIFCAILGCSLSCAQLQVAAKPDVTYSVKLDSSLSVLFAADEPGCAVLVLRDSTIVFQRNYGMANLALDMKVTQQTRFYVASLAKSFTAAAIMLLREDSRLQLADSPRKFIPELPTWADGITLRQILSHISGLPDHYDLLGEESPVLNNDSVLALMIAQDSLLFKPGADWNYSNSGFDLLAIIVERISGQNFESFVTNRIFEPLDMTGARYYTTNNQEITPRAIGYVAGEESWEISDYSSIDVGAGGVYATIDDLRKWDKATYSDALLPPSVWDELFTVQLRTNGKRTPYGLGWMVECFDSPKNTGPLKDRCYVMQIGSLVGFRSFMQQFRDERFTVIALSNRGNIDFAYEIADLYLAGE